MTAIAFAPTRKKEPAATDSQGRITQERYDRNVAALRAYKSSSNSTWKEVATALGGSYTESSVTVFANGKYPLESAHNIIERVEQFLALVEERRLTLTQPTFVLTSIAKRIFSVIKQSELLLKIGVIGAESGTGKTSAINEWHITHLNTTLIRANRTFAPSSSASQHSSSPFPTLLKIARAVGYTDTAPSRRQTLIYDAVVDALRGSNRVLMFDEAHFLPSEALDITRTIHEDARIPIVLAGHATLYDRGPREHESLIAYRSRALREKVTTAQVRASDVELIASQIVGVDVARDASRVLLQEAQSNGGFRRLVTLLQVAQTYRDTDHVTKDQVLRAIEERPQDGGL
jgi:DNA transposition AAA+ family ATPase